MNPAATENRRVISRKQMGASMLEEQTKVEELVSRPLTSTHKPRRYPRIAVLGPKESMAWVVRLGVIREFRVLDIVVRLVVNMELVIVVRLVGSMELVTVVKLVGSMVLVTTVVGLVVNMGSSVLVVNMGSSVLVVNMGSSVLVVNRGSSLMFLAGQIRSSKTSESSGYVSFTSDMRCCQVSADRRTLLLALCSVAWQSNILVNSTKIPGSLADSPAMMVAVRLYSITPSQQYMTILRKSSQYSLSDLDGSGRM